MKQNSKIIQQKFTRKNHKHLINKLLKINIYKIVYNFVFLIKIHYLDYNHEIHLYIHPIRL